MKIGIGSKEGDRLEQTYEEAVTEVLDILNHTSIEDVKKINPKFIEHLKQHSSKTYVPNFDHTQKLKDMNLKPKTRALICLIYREYFCDENQKKEYDKRIVEVELEYQKELKAKYNTDNLFRNRISRKQEAIQEITIVKDKEQNFFEKILNAIPKLFKKNN